MDVAPIPGLVNIKSASSPPARLALALEATRHAAVTGGSPVIADFNGLYEREMGNLATTAELLANLDQASRSRAQTLFSLGTDVAYGAMLQQSFALTADVRNRTKHFLPSRKSLLDSVVLGLHVRHTGKNILGENVDYLGKCLEKWLNVSVANSEQQKLFGDRTRCTLLVASDRPRTLSGLERLMSKMKYPCQFVAIPKDTRDISGVEIEHGPWPGMGSAQDLYLLSHARDGMMYSYEGKKGFRSTFTLLAVEMAAIRRVRAGFNTAYHTSYCPSRL